MTANAHPVFVVCLVLSLAGCVKSPTEPESGTQTIPPAAGVYVLNEGNYGDVAGARLSLYIPATDTVFRSIVEDANGGAHLGSTGDDFTLFRGNIYVLMSGSERLVVLSGTDHHILRDVYYPGSTPHSMLIDSSRNLIYLTRLFKNSILLVNLQTLQVADSLAVGQNPMDMVLSDGKLFVCNSGYGADRTLSVIDPGIPAVVAAIQVGAGASGIVKGSDGKLWVACTGDAFSVPARPGSVYRINPSTHVLEDSILFAQPLGGTVVASADGYLYVIGSSSSYFGGPVHRISIATLAVTPDYVAGSFYGAGVDDANGDLYLADAKSFSAAGVVSIYTRNGTLKHSFVAERGPSLFLFKR
jgi:DNA-binding beta-propeller fold protein YncE